MREYVEAVKLAPAAINVYVKLESFNPMGSVKDRMARAVIERVSQEHPQLEQRVLDVLEKQALAFEPREQVVAAAMNVLWLGFAAVRNGERWS